MIIYVHVEKGLEVLTSCVYIKGLSLKILYSQQPYLPYLWTVL